jgi:uncharacterized protein YmfQ (DUF2313 family)
MIQNQPLPAGDTVGDRIARELALLIGPSRQPVEGSLAAAELHTLGDSLADVYSTESRALAQIFPNTATDLLTEWEQRLGLPTDLSLPTSTRQAAVQAKRRASGGGTRQRVLAAAQAIDPVASIYTNASTAVTYSPRWVFMIAIRVLAGTWNDPAKRAALIAVTEQMKPAHCACNVVTRVGFLCDDAASLTDRDALG